MASGAVLRHFEPARVVAFQLEAKPRPGQIWIEASVCAGLRCPVEKHLLDSNVIMEILDVPDAAERAARREVERRRGVRRQRDSERVGERASLNEARDARAARRVGLQHVYRAGFEHASKVTQVVAVLAGSDLDGGRGTVAQQPKAF